MSCPESVIAQMKIHGMPALLCDAFYVYEVQSYLMRQLAENKEVKTGEDSILFKSNNELSSFLQEHVQSLARMHSGDENNTSITYNNKFFLKMYRKC